MTALHTSVALALLSLRQLVPTYTPIGNINFLDGGVQVISATSSRLAETGTFISEGDTIKTARNAWALLSMCDGARMILRPGTQLRFDAYRFHPQNETSENASLLSLTIGAFRSITGYIGQQNPSAYLIVTPASLIGIRGTDHEPAYFPLSYGTGAQQTKAGTYDKVNVGQSFICNSQGEVCINAGQTAFAADDTDSQPHLLTRMPMFYPRYAVFDRRIAACWQDLYRRVDRSRQLLEPQLSNQRPPIPKLERRHQPRT